MSEKWSEKYSLSRSDKLLVILVPGAALLATIFAVFSKLQVLDLTREILLRR